MEVQPDLSGQQRRVKQAAPYRAIRMARLSETKLVVLDMETTGLSPAMDDRVVELGMIVRQGTTEISHSSHLVNPGRPISWNSVLVHRYLRKYNGCFLSRRTTLIHDE